LPLQHFLAFGLFLTAEIYTTGSIKNNHSKNSEHISIPPQCHYFSGCGILPLLPDVTAKLKQANLEKKT